jgi:hypothetical protein
MLPRRMNVLFVAAVMVVVVRVRFAVDDVDSAVSIVASSFFFDGLYHCHGSSVLLLTSRQ